MKGGERVEMASPEDQGPLALRIQDLEAQLRAAREALTEARRSFHQQCLEAQEAADQKIRALEAECLKAQQAKAGLEAALETLRHRVHPLETECLEALLENRRLQSELDERDAEQGRQVEALSNALLAANALNARLEEDMRRLYASASFRLTRPLRVLKALFLPRASS